MARIVRKITVCGFGLIGGSIALDLLKGAKSTRPLLVAYDRKRVLERLARDRRFNLSIEAGLVKAVQNSDIIILSAPHLANQKLLTRLSKVSNLTDCLIIDTGAVKTPIANMAHSLDFQNGTQFLPTHPMAGREKSGFENSASGLFQNHAWYLDDTAKLTSHNRRKLDWMTRKLGAMLTWISSESHDRLVAEISHLPQLISTSLGSQIEPRLIDLAGPGLKSMLRLAGSPYEVWSEIIDQNRKEITTSLNAYIDNLKLIAELIESNKSLIEIFASARRSYKCL